MAKKTTSPIGKQSVTKGQGERNGYSRFMTLYAADRKLKGEKLDRAQMGEEWKAKKDGEVFDFTFPEKMSEA